jgi:capsular polysaccharide biosynthesis protein
LPAETGSGHTLFTFIIIGQNNARLTGNHRGNHSMNLVDLIRILVRRGWMMLLLAVIAGGSAYYLSTQQAPIYRAVQVVLMEPSRIDLGLTEASRGTIENNIAYINSSIRAGQVIERLRLDMDPQALMGNSTITPNRNNLTVRIEVDSYAPEVASDIARTWGNLLIEYRNERNQTSRQEDRMTAVLQDDATVAQIRPRPQVNALAGAVLGFIIGGGIALFLEFLESGILRSREDVERSLNVPVLAGIPD